MNGLVSSVYELWRGGPQGGLLTVILFNINSNWLSDICQPGIPSSYRFSLAPVPVPVPRDAIQQTRDCPPAMLPPFQHLGNHNCPYNPKCKHAEWQLMVPLNPPAASKPSTSQNIPSESLPTGCLNAKTDAPCRVTAIVGGSGVPCVETGPFCLPVLDLEGLCHCSRFEIAPHVPVLPQLPGSCFPLCREDSLRLLYIDDASLAQRIDLNSMLVPLLQTAGPHGRMAGCGMGIPGQWLSLQHKLRDVIKNTEALGMQVNSRKTKILMINDAHTKQAVPLVSATDGDTILCVAELKLLGLVFDEKLCWWPMVTDLVRRTRTKLWALMRLREAGASLEVLKVNYCSKVRTILEYCGPVWGCFVSGIQEQKIESCQIQALQIILGAQASSYEAYLATLELERLTVRRQRPNTEICNWLI